MANEITDAQLNALSDDDIDEILNGIDNGLYEEDENASDDNQDGNEDEENADDNSGSDESEDENADEDEDSNDDEDTDGSEDEDDSTEGDNDSDGDQNDNDDEDEDEDQENSHEDDNGNDNDKDGSDTDGDSDGKAPKTANTIDSKEFEKYKKFYDELTQSEFVANGKKVKGFTDTQKIIQAQQMAAGYSDKMAGFKPYRQFMTPLKESGMLEDPEKFNFMMDLAKGDKEALKKHLKTLEIDPLMDLDTESIDYKGSNHLASSDDIAIEDAMTSARGMGVEKEIRQAVGAWDDTSLNEFVKDPAVRRDLIDHMSSGAYDIVQDKIFDLKRTDGDGTFSQMSDVSQYRAAVVELQNESRKEAANQAIEDKKASEQLVEEEKAKILADRKAADYKAGVEKQNKKANEARKKATSVSKKKKPVKAKKKFDPMDLEDDDLDAFVDSLIDNR